MNRPSSVRDSSTSARAGFAIEYCGLTGLPSSSQARKYFPSSAKCAASSRASTVFGWVPAATKIVSRRKPGLAGFVPLPVLAEALHCEADALRRAVFVDVDRERREALGERDAFLERLLDLLVVERVRGTVDQAPAVGDRHAAPALQQLDKPGRAPRPRPSARSARIARACARNSSAISRSSGVPRLADRVLADLGGERLVAVRGTSRPAPRSRRATRSQCRSRSGRRR